MYNSSTFKIILPLAGRAHLKLSTGNFSLICFFWHLIPRLLHDNAACEFAKFELYSLDSYNKQRVLCPI